MLLRGVYAPPTQALFRALHSERSDEQKSLRTLLHWCYSRLHGRRRLLRKLMGTHLHTFSISGGSAGHSAGVSTVLQVLACIVRGFPQPLDAAARGLFDHLLLELHSPNGTTGAGTSPFVHPCTSLTTAGRVCAALCLARLTQGMAGEMLPILATYHAPLVQAMARFIDKDQSLVVEAVRGVVAAWPTAQQASSSKVRHHAPLGFHHVAVDAPTDLPLPQRPTRRYRVTAIAGGAVAE